MKFSGVSRRALLAGLRGYFPKPMREINAIRFATGDDVKRVKLATHKRNKRHRRK